MNINENICIKKHNSGNISDPVDKAICNCRYKFPPKHSTYQKQVGESAFFVSTHTKIWLLEINQNIGLKKTTMKNTIWPKILKVSWNTSDETLQNLFN